ncbi:hypothetical protein GCM10023107_11140 [Actinoplanes octamycinicus]|nr:hypothetical protein Aoc01nite_76500 [Actinoplanes octamycinicus]
MVSGCQTPAFPCRRRAGPFDGVAVEVASDERLGSALIVAGAWRASNQEWQEVKPQAAVG